VPAEWHRRISPARSANCETQGANLAESNLEETDFDEAQVNDKTDFFGATFDKVVMVPLVVPPPGGRSWLLSSLMSSFKEDDDNDGEDENDEG